MTTPHGLGYTKVVIVVDEDVDPFDLPQVMWALSTKVNPASDLVNLPATDLVVTRFEDPACASPATTHPRPRRIATSGPRSWCGWLDG